MFVKITKDLIVNTENLTHVVVDNSLVDGPVVFINTNAGDFPLPSGYTLEEIFVALKGGCYYRETTFGEMCEVHSAPKCGNSSNQSYAYTECLNNIARASVFDLYRNVL